MKNTFRISGGILLFLYLVFLHACKKDKSTNPLLTTESVTNVTQSTATSGGNVTSDGGAPVTERGVCWSTSTNPSIADSKTMDGTGTGSFTSSLTGLDASTTYYLKAYATNSAGTGYGNTISFNSKGTITDIDGNVYNTITIGNQTWMQENLNTTRYSNGDLLTNIIGEQWDNVTIGAYCSYNNNENNRLTYGLIYNWYAANDPGKICPVGWHIPSLSEWETLGYTGLEVKESDTLHWMYPNVCYPNSSGFNALPGGNCGYDGNFNSITEMGYWWCAGEEDTENGYIILIGHNSAGLSGYVDFPKWIGGSIRCIKD